MRVTLETGTNKTHFFGLVFVGFGSLGTLLYEELLMYICLLTNM